MVDEEIGYRLGALAAERDPLLRPCFIRSEVIRRVLEFRSPKNIIIGKKGSGKSAIFLVGRGPRSKIPVVRISPTTHLVDVKNPTSSHTQYADIIKYEIALECLRIWSEDSSLMERLSSKDRALVKEAIGDYLNRIKKLGGRIEGVSAFGWGLSLGDKTESTLEIVSKQDISRIAPIVKKFASNGAKCLVLIDDPELLFGYSNQPPTNLLGGLLFASVDLAFLVPTSIRVVVFLKLHIYHHLRKTFEDIDHLRHNFEMLRWTEDNLEELLSARLIKALSLQKEAIDQFNPWLALLGGGSIKDGKKVRSYILERLVCGPRDLIWFSSQILDMLGRGFKGWNAVHVAEANYSNDQINQLELEYGNRGYSEISSVVSKLFDPDDPELKTEMGASNFEEFLKKRMRSNEIIKQREKHDWLEALTPKTLAHLLFNVGVLGYWVQHDARYLMPYEIDSELRGFLASPKWRLSPAYYRALGID